METPDVSGFNSYFFACHSTRGDRDRENDTCFYELVLVRKVRDAFLIYREVESQITRQKLLRANLEDVFLIRKNRLNSCDTLDDGKR